MNIKQLLSFWVIFCMAITAQAAEFHVTTSQQLQGALSTASANGGDDTLFLAAGTYIGNFRYPSTEANALTLKPETGVNAGQVILDGNLMAYVMMIDVGELAANVTIEKLVFQNGSGTSGGGLHITTKGDVNISQTGFVDNQASSGGGVYIKGADEVTLTDNSFSGNSAGYGNGGGANISGGTTVSLTNNSFSGNSGDTGGGALIIDGTTVSLTNNSFSGNSCRNHGGGAFVYRGTVTLTNNSFSGNSSDYGGGGASIDGGTTVTLTNNSFSGNFSSFSYGGGAYINAEQLLNFINNTAGRNTGGGVYFKIPDTTGTLNVYNNIIYGNTSTEQGADIFVSGYGESTNLYNNIYTDMKALWTNQGGNKTVDPLFFDPDNGDFHLKSNSPAIDAGLATAPSVPTTDLDGNARTANPDIGAYEHATTALHPADTNNNWNLEQSEFNAYNTAWRNSTDWQNGPNPIIMDYVTRAGYLFKSGGVYHNTGAGRPMCWEAGSK